MYAEPNKYTVNGDTTTIELKHDVIATIDTDMVELAKEYHWVAAFSLYSDSIYIMSQSKARTKYLKRLIVKARSGTRVVCKDKDSLNLKRSNLKTIRFNNKVKKTCLGCGEEFATRRHKAITCNKDCYIEYKIKDSLQKKNNIG